MSGGCLAGSSCLFSHDPATLMTAMNINDGSAIVGTPPNQLPTFTMQEQYEAFPSLQPGYRPSSSQLNPQGGGHFPTFIPANQRSRSGQSAQSSRPQSRPTSRHQHREFLPSAPSVDDPEAFPTLSSLNAKAAKKHHGKRGGHGHNRDSKENTPSSLADVVRMSPSPAPGQKRPSARLGKVSFGGRENTAAAQAIASPRHIPWLETGTRANQQYLKYRQEAIKYGSVRNKFLQRWVLTTAELGDIFSRADWPLSLQCCASLES